MSPVRVFAVMGAAAMGTTVTREPVIWWIFGEPFHAGPTVVCFLAVIITRIVIGLQAQGKAQWALDAAVTALCLLVTVLWVQDQQLELLAAGITGIGIGALGAGIIGIAKGIVGGRIKAALDAFLGTSAKPEKKPAPMTGRASGCLRGKHPCGSARA